MVEAHTDKARTLMVLTPNKSMSWETNKKILFVMFAVNMAIGIAFAMQGAWLILPFAGLEILLVAIGTYYVCWRLNFQETIAIEGKALQLKKGVYYPKQVWQWQKRDTALLTQPSHYRLSAPTLFLKHLNETVEIGNFLTRTEKINLRDQLVKLGIPVITLAK